MFHPGATHHGSGEARQPRRPGWTTVVVGLSLAGAVIATLGLFSGGRPAGSAPMSSRPQSADLELALVDGLVEDELARLALPGAALAITKGDQTVHVRGFGHDSTGAPLTADSLFRVASLSKSMTAMAVMQLVDAGRLRLDDTVCSHLPEFRPADPRAARITVRQVLNQTSGLADHGFNELEPPQPRSLTEAVARLNTANLVAEPGARWNYHNPNYELAARLVEVTSGQPFAEYLRDRVFGPAGMTGSRTTTTDNEPVAGLADGHVMAYGHALAVGLPDDFGEGAGDVVSSARDMAKWLIVNANHGRSVRGLRLVSEDALRQMHSASTPTGYGFGWSERHPAGSPSRAEHTGNLLTFSAFQAVIPETGDGLVMLFNSGSASISDQEAIFDQVFDLVVGTQGSRVARPLTGTAIDLLLAGLTFLIAAAGTMGVARSRRWATRATRLRRWRRLRVTLRLAPLAGALALVAAFPAIAGSAVGGRAVTWTRATYAWPAAVVLVGAVLVATVAALTARGWQLLALSRRARAGQEPPTGRSGARPNQLHGVLSTGVSGHSQRARTSPHTTNLPTV